MREGGRVWEKHEQPIELQVILDQNFVKDTKERWQVPDPKNEAHLEQIRNRALLKEFEQHRESKAKMKVVGQERTCGLQGMLAEGRLRHHHPDGQACSRGGHPGRPSVAHVLRQRPDEERRMIRPI